MWVERVYFCLNGNERDWAFVRESACLWERVREWERWVTCILRPGYFFEKQQQRIYPHAEVFCESSPMRLRKKHTHLNYVQKRLLQFFSGIFFHFQRLRRWSCRRLKMFWMIKLLIFWWNATTYWSCKAHWLISKTFLMAKNGPARIWTHGLLLLLLRKQDLEDMEGYFSLLIPSDVRSDWPFILFEILLKSASPWLQASWFVSGFDKIWKSLAKRS